MQALKFDVEFHDAIATLCGNERSREGISRYRLLVRGLSRLAGMIENLHDAFDEHLDLLCALAARDAMAIPIDVGSAAYSVCKHLR